MALSKKSSRQPYVPNGYSPPTKSGVSTYGSGGMGARGTGTANTTSSRRKPPKGGTYTPPGNIVVSVSGGYTNVTQDSFTAWKNARDAMSVEDAWNQLVTGAGIDTLGVPTNWWPGLSTMNPAEAWRYQPGSMDYLDKERGWKPLDRNTFTFTNTDTGETITKWVRYDPNRAAQQYMKMGQAERAKFSEMMVNAGLLDEEWAGIGDFHPTAAGAFANALSLANYYGITVESVLDREGKLFAELKARAGGGGRGGGGGGPKIQLEVPDYETLVQQAKETLRGNLGRDPEDWEMTLVADEMKRQYGKWADATRARMVGGNGTFEIPDPQVLTQAFVEDTYANEIQRLEDVADTAQINQLLIGAATRGTQMMGGIGGG